MLKAYIKINLAKSFIRLSKLLVGVSIFFDYKLNGSFCLYINYCGLNNLTIKNLYPLPLMSKSFDCLGRAKWFTQLDLTNTYQ